MGYLTTHVLDTTNGVPASGVAIKLFKISDTKELIAETTTNSDGRCDSPILAEADFAKGKYELEFAIGDYYRRLGIQQEEPLFLDDVVLRFGINDVSSHYHVPVLVSPYSYSTYRGS